jgi:hypothetical protein
LQAYEAIGIGVAGMRFHIHRRSAFAALQNAEPDANGLIIQHLIGAIADNGLVGEPLRNGLGTNHSRSQKYQVKREKKL